MQDEAPLRLVFVTSIPRWGGGERWMLDCAAGLKERGHDVVLAARPGATILQRAREADVCTHAIRMRGDLDPRPLFAMRALLKQQRPHAVFVNLDKELRYVCLATHYGYKPLIFPRRGSDDPLKDGFLNRYVYGKRVTRILTNCEHLATTRVAAESSSRRDLVRVVFNGVAVREMDNGSDPNTVRRALTLPRRQPLILHVGELEARKGQETSLRALALLLEKQATTHERAKPNLAFIGTGPDESRLREMSQDLGVQDHVIWVGFRKNVAEYLAAADLLVLPSQREGMPWTILEAMAQRLPVIASAVSGTPEVVEDGETGLLVPPGEPLALAQAMERILDDDALAEHLRVRGSEAVRQRWAAGHMLSDLECLVYGQLLRRHASSAKRSQRRPALFVDRDGTLIYNLPYNAQPDRVQLTPQVGRALRWVHDAGVPIIVVSNQSGVAQGFHTENDVHRVNARVQALLREEGAAIETFYHCPHHPEHGPACDCRKPAAGMLRRAAAEHGLALDQSWMVGDNERDLEAGRRATTQVLGYVAPGADTDLSTTQYSSDWMTVARDFLRAQSRSLL